MLLTALAILTAYLVGSIPTSFIFARLLKGVDIRNYGSGNVGATNLLRITGKLPAVLALLLDIVKGALAVSLVPHVFSNGISWASFDELQLMLGITVVCGHIWPVFLKFKGGKGVATSAGVMIILAPKVILIAFAVCFLTVGVSRYVSLGAILAAVSLPISAAVMGGSVKLVTLCIMLTLIVCYKHKANIKRLTRGEEPKLGKKVEV